MFVKQIDKEKALEILARGIDVPVMVPKTEKPESWIDYRPDMLGNVLEGIMFFRPEPAMEKGMFEELGKKEIPPPPIAPAEKKEKSRRSQVDTGKLVALRNAGWSMKKIAEELKVSEGTVFNYLKKLEGEKDGKEN